jgi:thiamine-phosphate pyrophosphorylase
MSSSPVYRVIDENLNRLSEGLRVLEDAARMLLDDPHLTGRLKTLRHNLIRSDLPLNLKLLQSRNSTGDVGAAMEVAGENKQQDLPLILIANSRRAQESLRVLEEMSKLSALSSVLLDSNRFREARFEVYSLEQKLVSCLIRQDQAARVSGLYVIIDTQVLRGRDPLEAARQVVQAGVKVIQFRDKTMDKRLLLRVAGDLRDFCRQHGVLFIMNDYLDIALAVEADGLHIGQEDLPVETARRLLPPDRILGVSVTTPDLASAAASAGADYIAVGAVYPTFSKEKITVVGLETVHRIRQAVKTPLVAIGGINKINARAVIEAGADAVCVISAVLTAPDIIRAARDIIETIEAKE